MNERTVACLRLNKSSETVSNAVPGNDNEVVDNTHLLRWTIIDGALDAGTIQKTLVVGEAGEGGGGTVFMRSSLPKVIVPIVNVPNLLNLDHPGGSLHIAAFDLATVTKKVIPDIPDIEIFYANVF